MFTFQERTSVFGGAHGVELDEEDLALGEDWIDNCWLTIVDFGFGKRSLPKNHGTAFRDAASRDPLAGGPCGFVGSDVPG